MSWKKLSPLSAYLKTFNTYLTLALHFSEISPELATIIGNYITLLMTLMTPFSVSNANFERNPCNNLVLLSTLNMTKAAPRR